MGKYQRTKGHSFERKVVNDIKHIFPEARRHLEYQDGEAYGVDIANTGDFLIQCKKHADYVPVNTINEIQNVTEMYIPIVVTAGDRLEPMAILPWKKLIRLIDAYEQR